MFEEFAQFELLRLDLTPSPKDLDMDQDKEHLKIFIMWWLSGLERHIISAVFQCSRSRVHIQVVPKLFSFRKCLYKSDSMR